MPLLFSLICPLQVPAVAASAQSQGPIPNPTGWEWAMGPAPYEPFTVAGARGLALERQVDEDGLVLRVVHPIDEKRLEYRPVAFSGDGERHDFEKGRGVRGEGFVYTVFRLPESSLPEQEIDRIGLEVLTVQGERELAERARAEARSLGMELLVPPEPGEPLELSLTSIDGSRITDESLEGKVVLVDVWATWCAPCMAKMPDLVELYERLHPKGLEIVGVNMDRDPESFRQARKELDLSWPQVFVPAEREKRRLWERATGIEALPRQLLLDHRGILRHDLSSSNGLESRIRKLIGEEDG